MSPARTPVRPGSVSPDVDSEVLNGRRTQDAGGATVEAALGVCSVVTVFLLALAGMGAVIGQLRGTDAAVEAARLASRGERERAAEVVATIAPDGATVAVRTHRDEVAVEVRSPLPGGVLPGRWLTSRAYAVLEPGVPSPGGETRP